MKSKFIFIIGALAITFAGCNPFYSVEQSMVERGYRWVHRGEMSRAIATFEMTIQKYPQSVLAQLGLADTLFEARKDREAVDSYTRAMLLLEKAKPKSDVGKLGETEVIGERFFSYQNQGLKFPHGLEAYLYLRRGGAFESLATRDSRLNHEYFSKAIADYDKAIELAPKYEEVKKMRNRLLARSNGASKIDVPMSLASDMLLLPVMVPKAIIEKIGGKKSENSEETETNVPVTAPPPSLEPVAVYLLPLDDFPFDYASQLARTLSEDLKINVRASLPMGTSDLSPFSDGIQYPAEDIIEGAYKVGMRLSDRAERSAVIALTVRDLNDRSRQLRFLFAQHDKSKHTSVISTARMRYGTSTQPATADMTFLRIYKMIKRTIGDQYLELPRSGNINDVMYSPIMSLDDLDELGIQYLGLNK